MAGLIPNPFSPDWPYLFEITANNSLIVDFPPNFTFDLSRAPDSFWDHVNADGSDIRVMDFDALLARDRQCAITLTNFSRVGKSGTLTISRRGRFGKKFFILCGNAAATVPVASTKYGSNFVGSNSDALVLNYNETGATTSSRDLNAAGSRTGASFKLPTPIGLNRASFYMKKTGNPTGTAIARLFALVGIYRSTARPSNNSAVLTVSSTIDVTTITSAYSYIAFSFAANRAFLSANVLYGIEVEYTGGDASNLLTMLNPTFATAPIELSNTFFSSTNGASYQTNGSNGVPLKLYGVHTEFHNTSTPSFWTISPLRLNTDIVPSI